MDKEVSEQPGMPLSLKVDRSNNFTWEVNWDGSKQHLYTTEQPYMWEKEILPGETRPSEHKPNT